MNNNNTKPYTRTYTFKYSNSSAFLVSLSISPLSRSQCVPTITTGESGALAYTCTYKDNIKYMYIYCISNEVHAALLNTITIPRYK